MSNKSTSAKAAKAKQSDKLREAMEKFGEFELVAKNKQVKAVAGRRSLLIRKYESQEAAEKSLPAFRAWVSRQS